MAFSQGNRNEESRFVLSFFLPLPRERAGVRGDDSLIALILNFSQREKDLGFTK